MNKGKFVLDACALLALLNKEKGGDKVNELFKQAKAGEITLYMSIVNLIEVFYGLIRDQGLDRAVEILKQIDNTPLKIVDTIPPPIYHEASRLKGANKMSLADAIGIATAESLNAAFVTSDHQEGNLRLRFATARLRVHELDAVEKHESFSFFWFR
jgi:predicted nucleic acid-binding protein